MSQAGSAVYAGQETGTKGAKEVRFGYAQVREYGSFAQVLLEFARELVKEGSISESFLKKYEGRNFEESIDQGDTLKLWNDICDANTEGAAYRFTREAFFDLNLMDEEDLPQIANRDDVDITLAMGTSPGVYLIEHEKKNKFMSLYAADPIASKIVKSETERYTDNSYAMMDYTGYRRQLQVGYNFLHFKKLGIVCEDSEIGKMQASVGDIEFMAEKLGFETLYEYVDEPVDDDDFDRYYKELKEGYRKLIDRGADCIYITVSAIDYEAKMMELLEDAIIPKKIKTLAQDDLAPVAFGALFGVTISDANQAAAHIFNELERYVKGGVPFDELEMIDEQIPKMGLNFSTAKRIGLDIKFMDLQMMDRIYRNDK